jgi:hypothetical protein
MGHCSELLLSSVMGTAEVDYAPILQNLCGPLSMVIFACTTSFVHMLHIRDETIYTVPECKIISLFAKLELTCTPNSSLLYQHFGKVYLLSTQLS